MNIQTKIEELLIGADREGMVVLLDYMKENGFFAAPCSGQYHLSKEGGLAEHSLNVLKSTRKFANAILPSMDYIGYEKSIIIVSLLHDLGKMGQFSKPNYVPNMVTDRKTKELVQSEKKPYETNKNLLPVPHEIRSIQIASQFIELTEEENFAILHHNGLYGDLKYQLNGKERPLQMLLHFADMWASRVIEKED